MQFSVTKKQLTYTRKRGIIIKENTAFPCLWAEQKPRELFNYCHGRLLHSQCLCWALAEGWGGKYLYCSAGNSACNGSGAEPNVYGRAYIPLAGCWRRPGRSGLSLPVLGDVGSRWGEHVSLLTPEIMPYAMLLQWGQCGVLFIFQCLSFSVWDSVNLKWY